MAERPESAELRTLPVFNGLTDDEIAELLGPDGLTRYAAGETIVAEGTDSGYLYVLLSGKARILMAGNEGVPQEIGEVERGTVVGEIAFLIGGKHVATAVAAEPTTALRIERETFYRLCAEGRIAPYKLAYNLARALCVRLRMVDEKLVDLLELESARERREELAQLKHKLFTEWSF